ncbi:hypothetical protein [Enterovirga sp. CN4-39]
MPIAPAGEVGFIAPQQRPCSEVLVVRLIIPFLLGVLGPIAIVGYLLLLQ